MGKKINLNFLFVFGLFIILALIFYYPIFYGKVPLNGNLLAAYWSPWRYVSWENYPTGIPFKFVAVDEIREFFPLLDFTFDSIHSGFIPLWNPYNFSGYPHLANWASAVFYPLHIVIFIFNKYQTLIFLKLSAIVLSGIFTYLYLRSIRLDKESSLFGGLAFAFSAPMLIWGAEIWQSVHSFLWLPLMLFSIEKLFQTRKIFYCVPLACGSAFSVMGGYIQPTIYVFLFTGTYILFKCLHERANMKFSGIVRTLLLIVVSLVLGAGLSAIHTFPAIEFFINSPRKNIALTEVNLNFLLPLSHIVTFFVPDFFGHAATGNWFAKRPGQYYESMIFIGVIPLVLSSFAFLLKQYRKYVYFFVIWVIIALSLIFDLPTSRLLYHLSIPFLSTAIPIRIIFLVAFSLSVLGAFGIFWWRSSTKKDRKQIISCLFPTLFIYVLIGGFLLLSYLYKEEHVDFPINWYITALRNLVIPFAIASSTALIVFIGWYFKKHLRNGAYIVLLALLIAHALLFAKKYFVYTDKDFLYPNHPLLSYIEKNQGSYRYFGYSDAALANNFSTIYNIYSPEGYDPVNIRWYNEFLSASSNGKYTGIASRSDALIQNTNDHPFSDTNKYRLRVLDLLGVKYIGYYNQKDEPQELKKNDRFKLLQKFGKFSLFENKKAFERAFFVPEAIFIPSKEETIETVYNPNFDLKKKVILDKKEVVKKFKDDPNAKVKIVEYSPNKVTMQTSSTTPQYLVLTDSYYPGWKASIDEKPSGIYRANYTFRTVLVPQGNHTVVFQYRPFSFMLGAFVSAASLIIILGMGMVLKLHYN